MLYLYIFGTLIERHWKGKKFLTFYLVCGAIGGILYPLFVYFNILRPLPMVGASGAIYGLLAAAAIMFPMLRMYIWGILPIRLYVLALVYLFVSISGFSSGDNRGGEMAHLAGMAAGAIYVLYKPITSRISSGSLNRRQNKFIKDQLDLKREVDRILQKVSDKGIHSLTISEKRTLKKATRSQHQNRQ
jgi:membrane associated rhomboid family serine protease